MKSEQVTPVDSIKDVVRSSVKVPEFDKHLKKAGGHMGRNVVTPEEGWWTYGPKCCGNNNKDEDNSLKTLNDKGKKM